jgi:hypothetical protein
MCPAHRQLADTPHPPGDCFDARPRNGRGRGLLSAADSARVFESGTPVAVGCSLYVSVSRRGPAYSPATSWPVSRRARLKARGLAASSPVAAGSVTPLAGQVVAGGER